MYLGKKEFEAFKSETISYLNTIEKNQEGMLEILKVLVSGQNDLQKRISVLEESAGRLESLIAENEATNSKKLADIMLTLIKETDKIKRNHSTNMKQIREAVNLLMLEGLLDRAEMLCETSGKSAGKVKPKRKVTANKICPLCGALVLDEDNVCLHCGHKF